MVYVCVAAAVTTAAIDVVADVANRTKLEAQVKIQQPEELEVSQEWSKVLQEWLRVLILLLILVLAIYKDFIINKTHHLF